jgi:protein-disulfide isomerase
MENIENPEIIESKPNTTNKANQGQIAGAIVVAGLLIAGAILLKGNTAPLAPTPVANNGNNIENIQLEPISKDDHILGNIKAKVVIVEYSDLECPFCKVFHQTMQQVLINNKDIAWVYRHYPISTLHAKAMSEAIATECAWEQGGNTAFWQFADKIFEITTSNDGLDSAELPKIAGAIGLDVNAFNNCLASGKFEEKIQNEIANANKAGVRGTPKSFILKNGKVVDTIDGAQSVNVVLEKIKQASK